MDEVRMVVATLDHPHLIFRAVLAWLQKVRAIVQALRQRPKQSCTGPLCRSCD